MRRGKACLLQLLARRSSVSRRALGLVLQLRAIALPARQCVLSLAQSRGGVRQLALSVRQRRAQALCLPLRCRAQGLQLVLAQLSRALGAVACHFACFHTFPQRVHLQRVRLRVR
ncbi:MAG: hypothetical protein ACK41Y_16840, partial [Paracoccus hibiscisoli]|uniref:hypothetical protein n=1 Tax=Paracoccus hibiscisoli TaxID=2023261 RepID=UPI00391BA542